MNTQVQKQKRSSARAPSFRIRALSMCALLFKLSGSVGTVCKQPSSADNIAMPTHSSAPGSAMHESSTAKTSVAVVILASVMRQCSLVRLGIPFVLASM